LPGSEADFSWCKSVGLPCLLSLPTEKKDERIVKEGKLALGLAAQFWRRRAKSLCQKSLIRRFTVSSLTKVRAAADFEANCRIPSEMATLSSLDVNTTNSAVVAWCWNDTTRFLAEPDPQIRDITFTTRFDSIATFFQLNIPIRIKGIKTGTTLILRISPSLISSFEITQNPTIPSAVRDKFHSNTLCLNFRLNGHPDILVSAEAQEPLAPLRAQSGTVLDAIHELANTTAFSIYIKNSGASKAQLQPVCDAVSSGGVSLVVQDDLASMYSGMGAKIVILPAHTVSQGPQTELPQGPLHIEAPPPSYDQTEPPPPHAPLFESRKRRRLKDDRDERDEDIALIWAQLETIQARYGAEIKALREENLDLREEVDDLRKQVAASDKRHKDLKEEFDALETRTEIKGDELGDEMDIKIIDARSEIQDLAESVKSMREDVDQDRLVDRVKYKVLEHIRTSLSFDMPPAD
jgi:FtsZ-binding cell division protein ZapB